jgi:hypothetical protein
MWSSGAVAALASYESAVRLPLPVMMTASAWPALQPGRFTISWITAVRSGVR